ncbi:hypothetical protein JCM19046_4409 [Bacillus sp. JCM 19046]|nr:hypothetical protein JCM19045_4622 [Bacillus sp. JCM 19045]GAF19737.1 hypothetical protein JCM19046_4409 [Bacillus sp. JCM 19046]
MIEPFINGVLYTVLALLAGLIVMELVPTSRGLKQKVPAKIVLGVILLVPVVYSGYVLQLGVTYANFFSIPFFEGMLTALNDHVLGTSFLIIGSITIVMVLLQLFLKSKFPLFTALIQLVLLLGHIVAVSLSSHSASLTDMQGVLSNAIHVTAMAFWTGPLFVVSVYGKQLVNDKTFHQWFSAVAVFCLLLLGTSGIVMMGEIAPEYVHSWMLTYGQLLLIKNILIAPLLVFGFRHLIHLSGKGKALTVAERQRSFRTESIFVLLVFIVTAWLTETEPPHNVLRTLQFEPMNPIVPFFLSETLIENQLITFAPSIGAILLLVASGLLLLFAVFAAWWFRRTWVTAAASASFVVVFYLALMSGSAPGEIPVNLTVHDSVEEAIQVRYEEDELELLATVELDEDSIGVIYAVNERHLVAERLLVEADGYRKYLDAEVEMENAFLTGGEQFMDTFMFLENDWVDQEKISTYVSVGVVPESIERVELVFSEETIDVPVTNGVFLNVLSVNQTFAEEHQYRLYDQNENLVQEIDKRQFVHEGHAH